MIEIDYYLNDGANWQAQAVLGCLRSQSEHAVDNSWNKEKKEYEAKLYVGRYENCREQGYIFSVRYKDEQRNYAVYEHRNSDNICVVVFDRKTIDTPTAKVVTIDVMEDRKNNYTKSFHYGEIVECTDYIIKDIHAFIDTLNDTL